MIRDTQTADFIWMWQVSNVILSTGINIDLSFTRSILNIIVPPENLVLALMLIIISRVSSANMCLPTVLLRIKDKYFSDIV